MSDIYKHKIRFSIAVPMIFDMDIKTKTWFNNICLKLKGLDAPSCAKRCQELSNNGEIYCYYPTCYDKFKNPVQPDSPLIEYLVLFIVPPEIINDLTGGYPSPPWESFLTHN